MKPKKLNEEYNKTLKKFERIVFSMTALSQGSANVYLESTRSRQYWASVLFVRLTVYSISMLQLLPRNKLSPSTFEQWAFSPIASMTRNIFECFIVYLYLCADEVQGDEWCCRFDIFNLHDCLRRKKMFHHLGNIKEADKFKKLSLSLSNNLKTNTFFKSLDERIQNKCIKAETLYLLSQDELINKFGLNANFYRGLYILWSSHVHTFPIGFYRSGENMRGTGIENTSDMGQIIVALDACIKFIRIASKAHLKLFPGSDSNITDSGKDILFKV